MNMITIEEQYEEISSVLKVLGHPLRLRILHEIGRGEACVCHLEAQLDIRQAALSQHLMALREAGLLVTRREGRFIYYRLADKESLAIIDKTADALGINISEHDDEKKVCTCPKCCD